MVLTVKLSRDEALNEKIQVWRVRAKVLNMIKGLGVIHVQVPFISDPVSTADWSRL
jgi:hypothetical protein